MADKKTASRAQKAVADVKKKTVPSKSGTSKSSGKSGSKNVTVVDDSKLPLRITLGLVCLGLFVLFFSAVLVPEGVLPLAVRDCIFGLIGKAGFYIAMPALLYLSIILVASGERAVKMRCISVLVFVLLCGCLYHMFVNNQSFEGGMAVVSVLFPGGKAGTTGGLLCGLIAMALRSVCGPILPYIILFIGAAFALLAAMGITLPSIIRAIHNRPRDDWEDEFQEERPEPAALVVNHIANKQIERKRQRREQLQQKQTADEEALFEDEEPEKSAKKCASKQIDRVSDLMNQIGGDVEEPVAAAHVSAPAAVQEQMVRQPEQTAADELIAQMPVLDMDAPIAPAPRTEKQEQIAQQTALPAAKREETPPQQAAGKVTAKEAAESAIEVADEIARSQVAQKPEYCFPPIDLLDPPSGNAVDGTAEMRENSRRLNETLASFKIDAHIINVTRGPSVTRYEVELDKGVRLNKLTTCADDIALSLGASGVRIAAVPGRISVVGIEVPNRIVTNVHLREVIDSIEFNTSKSKSAFAVGKDIGGSSVVGNIAKMPHMLIAGTTGSGKSVCMNSIIISLLYKASPDDVKLIMVDPKMVELGIYNGIPHLLIPVVTDPKKAAGSLQWAVTEMMRRYKIMSDAGVRDLASYNSIVDSQEVEGEKLPQVVVIIDELADLMLVAAKEVEDSICRIAQMGRAAGMHLIIATQRPSADVITGLMKANIPSRIAFSVASAMESRIILDTQGAEKLVGKGDMLYAPIGIGKPLRVQGCFVTDTEVEAVATYVKEHYVAEYDQSVIDDIEKKAVQTGKKTVTEPEPNDDDLGGDEMLPAAVDVILETGQASVSMLQRRLKLGYARAARIVDEMEEKGIVGPFQGSKPRAILITKEQWQLRKNGGNSQMEIDDLPFDTGDFDE